MRTYFGSQNTDSYYAPRAVVAIGNFDGVHLGHQEILKRARRIAETQQIPVTVYTFNPHPTIELRPELPLKLLMTYAEKRHQLEKLGVDFCVEESFHADFAQTSARDFFFEILLRRLHAAALVVGADFAFGKAREGSLDTLKAWCQENDVVLEVVAPLMKDGQWVSSSRIREALQSGRLDSAEELLGRPFFYRGEVVHGDKRGRAIGFPTANMVCEEKFPLPIGVYATSVFWRDRTFMSVTNIGRRPTFQHGGALNLIPIRIETHILDQNFDLYGEVLEVRFHSRIRDEKRFESVDALVTQIRSDVNLARQVLSSRNF